MRIAVVHSYYSSDAPSGENVAVDAQAAALQAAGHDVRLVSQRTDERTLARTYPTQAALTVASGSGPSPESALRKFGPDVVHVHNLFPNFGTRWLARWPGPIVATLHNFRPICAAGTLFRDGRVCTECLDGERFADLSHGCYRGSRAATLPLAVRNRRGAARDAVIRRADALIVLSERARGVYERAGVDASRLHVVPNFADVPDSQPWEAEPNGRWLFAGRLSPEKGLVELLRCWPSGEPLDVVGDGPLRAQAEAIAPSDVRILGVIGRDALRAAMPTYLGLIFPSRCFESAVPLAHIEALSAGVPTVATEGNCAADDVLAHSLGATVPTAPATADLSRALEQVRAAGTRLRSACRESFDHRFSVHQWLTSMTSLYKTTFRP